MSYTRAASCSLETGARNMTDYIERKAAFDAAQEHFCDSARTLEAIETLPAADVRPVVRGRWERIDGLDELDPRMRCSVCGSVETPLARHRFCPVCAADMKGGESDG